jgi:NodT family efflux transporter outer membrane factor (OMF) lipoprotein
MSEPVSMIEAPVMSTLRSARRALAALAVGCLAACTVGPDFRGAPAAAPVAAKAAAFHRAPGNVSADSPSAAPWWSTLGDPTLTALIESALAHSPSVEAAEARLRASRASLREQKSDALPKVGGSVSYFNAELPKSALGVGDLNLYNLGFDATWEIDLFGGTRRAVQAASAQSIAVEADLADARVQLAAEVAQAYVDLRDRESRQDLARRSAELEGRILDLTEQRRAGGVASDLDVERIRTQVENTRASIIPLDEQIAESLDQLAVLTGREPGSLDAELHAPQPLPTLPASVSVGDPASMMRRRPDIRAAEFRLASQTAQIGEREADWFPKLSLLGDLGFTATSPGGLVRSGNFLALGVPYLQWNALDFGRTRARVKEAQAGRDEAEANYRQTVLEALRDADGSLSRYGHQRDYVAKLMSVESSATKASTLTEMRYRAGTSSALDWLDAERTRFSSEQDRVAGEAELIKDFVALQKSLGLGWQS